MATLALATSSPALANRPIPYPQTPSPTEEVPGNKTSRNQEPTTQVPDENRDRLLELLQQETNPLLYPPATGTQRKHRGSGRAATERKHSTGSLNTSGNVGQGDGGTYRPRNSSGRAPRSRSYVPPRSGDGSGKPTETQGGSSRALGIKCATGNKFSIPSIDSAQCRALCTLAGYSHSDYDSTTKMCYCRY